MLSAIFSNKARGGGDMTNDRDIHADIRQELKDISARLVELSYALDAIEPDAAIQLQVARDAISDSLIGLGDPSMQLTDEE